MSHRVILRSRFHLNYQKNLQVERRIRELKKDEAESTDASLELVLIFFLRKHPRFASDGWDWLD